MRSKTLVYAVAASAIFFASGFATGQRAGASKFDKYLRPAVRTKMDWMTLKASVEAIRANTPMVDDMSIPQVYFNYKENRPQASVAISSNFEKAPLETVRQRISQKCLFTYVYLKSELPDLSEDDFVLRVIRITTDPDRTLFAECKHGNVVFH